MNRHEFLVIIEANDANPNGDPDFQNRPRQDLDTGHGIITDVCLKRKIRNFVTIAKEDGGPGEELYFRQGAVLDRVHAEAEEATGFTGVAKKGKGKKGADGDEGAANNQNLDAVRDYMFKKYWDIRTFGAVMVGERNFGQVTGPVSISYARSVNPISVADYTITRSSATLEKDADKGKTMGRKSMVNHAVYVAKGFVNPFLADKTGFSDDDLGTLLTAVQNMFQFDQSAARPAGSMAVKSVVVFKHSSKLGDAPSDKLFGAVKVATKPGVEVPTSFEDYEVTIDHDRIPEGVEVTVL